MQHSLTVIDMDTPTRSKRVILRGPSRASLLLSVACHLTDVHGWVTHGGTKHLMFTLEMDEQVNARQVKSAARGLWVAALNCFARAHPGLNISTTLAIGKLKPEHIANYPR